MKNKLFTTLIISTLFLLNGCKKDLTGNSISIQANSNVPIDYFYLYNSCKPGVGEPLGSVFPLQDNGDGNYSFQLESGYESDCFTITGDVAANNDTSGKTIIDIDVFYTEEGNTVGFQDIELERPHGEYRIFYEFRPDTYIK
jgi:hypothetical protein